MKQQINKYVDEGMNEFMHLFMYLSIKSHFTSFFRHLLANKNNKIAQGNLHFPKGLTLGNISSQKIPFMNKKDCRICFSVELLI